MKEENLESSIGINSRLNFKLRQLTAYYFRVPLIAPNQFLTLPDLGCLKFNFLTALNHLPK